MAKVYVIDEIMGRGKTSAMINHINKSIEEGGAKRYIYITPYLTEVDRIQNACGFVQPEGEGEKVKAFKSALYAGESIVTTHALFEMIDSKTFATIRDYGYTLIMDETTSVVNAVKVTESDKKCIEENFVEFGRDGMVKWKDKDYAGMYDPIKDKIDTGCIYAYSDRTWIEMVHPNFITAFREVYIMTYMFDGQIMKYYLDLHGIPYQNLYVHGDSHDTYEIRDYKGEFVMPDYKSLVTILDNKKMNEIGDGATSLSKSWYIKHIKGDEVGILKKHIRNFFTNIMKVPTDKTLWTTFCKDDVCGVDWRKKLSGKGYTKGFLPCNARGTNLYADRNTLAYMVNRFPDMRVRNFLASRGIRVDADKFALSEMVQWVWRSAIRNGEPINLYVPSERMRTLFENWLTEVNEAA